MGVVGQVQRMVRGRVYRRRPGWHRAGVGGLWDEVGRLQFDFLVERGMRPEDWLLDVGCGSLRGGVHAIAYLEAGHYVGVEKERTLLDAARTEELPARGLVAKRPVLIESDDFDLSTVAATFDWMIAVSVFTHLEPRLIGRCLERVMPRLRPGGHFYASYQEADRVDVGEAHRLRRGERDVARYPFAVFEDLAARAGVKVERVGEWGHPRGQLMLDFHH